MEIAAFGTSEWRTYVNYGFGDETLQALYGCISPGPLTINSADRLQIRALEIGEAAKPQAGV
jgi:hypothetical protein